MNDFDRQLEAELARMLDRVVRAPVPPRRGQRRPRPLVKLHSAVGPSIGPVAPIVVLADRPADLRAEGAVPSPGLFS